MSAVRPAGACRIAAIRRVLWLTLLLNALVAAAKLVVGLGTGALSLVADGLHSSLDGASNVVGLLAITAAGRPPDADHPYGHRKLETVAAMAIGGMLAVASWEILGTAFERARHGAPPAEAGMPGFAVMAVTIAINAFVSWYEGRQGRIWGSEFLTADAAHTRSDIMVSASVVLALGAARIGWGWVDLVATLAIVAWILRQAWQVVRPALGTLSDEARLDADALESVARTVTGVMDVHRVRSRGHHDAVFVDLHVQVAPDTTVEQAHVIGHDVEDAIRGMFPQVLDVLTHVEPHGDPPEDLADRHAAGRA